VPFLVRGPEIPTEGLPDPPLVSNLDITATILAVAGAPRSDLDGSPLQKLAGGGWRKRMLVEHPARGWAMVRESNLVYMDWATGAEMYDLAVDPYQLGNRLHEMSRPRRPRRKLRSSRDTWRSCRIAPAS
jgi:arylsulfatase A-like enzyme